MNVVDDSLTVVVLPSGGAFEVYQNEVTYFNDRAHRYLADNHFVNIADLQDIDRMLILELLVWRYGNWVSRQRDYFGDPVNEKELNGLIKDNSAELRQIKKGLGIDKVARDKARGEDSVAEYIKRLGIRAREFGVNREKMLSKALELSMELIAKITLYDNTTEDERLEMRVRPEDIIDWIRTEYVPGFEAVDLHFRKHEQKAWIREQ